MNVRQAAAALGLFLGCAAASFVVVSAINGGAPRESQNMAGATQYPISDPIQPVAPATGNEEAVFEYSMEKLRANDVVEISSVDESGVCSVIRLDDQRVEGCVDAISIASGVAHLAIGREDGGFTIIGLVPDSVDSVQLGGVDVEINANIWIAELGPTDRVAAVDLTVGSSRSDTWVALSAD
jgi:hypothetical protein